MASKAQGKALTARVYHPTLNSWQDVRADAVSDWTDLGWKTTKPDHIDDSTHPFVELRESDGGTAEPIVTT